jgi:hypothetical protein
MFSGRRREFENGRHECSSTRCYNAAKMKEELVDAEFARLVMEDRPAAEFVTLLLDREVIVLHASGTNGFDPPQAIAVPGEHGRLVVAFTSGAQLDVSTIDRGDLQPVSVFLRTFLESVPPDIGLLLNPGCAVSRGIEWPFVQDVVPTFGAGVVRQEPTNAWLSALNEGLAARDIPPEGRPFEALSAYEKASGFGLSIGSARARRIFAWFESNTKPGTQLMPPFMLFAYYYDASFWSSPIPVILGQARISPYDSLQLPPQIFQRLMRDKAQALEYAKFWAQCYDYAYGTDDLLRGGATGFALNVAAAARDQVAAAAALLLEQRPNMRALEASALATEMSLKLFLAVRDGLTDDLARKQYRHGMPDLLSRCEAIAPLAGFSQITAGAGVFPGTAERYQQVERPRSDLWLGYALAVRAGAVVMNELTDRHASREFNAL